ncbi:MAG: hypothetical protein ICV74_03665 [Thermoleophilia bacterium]|nr:hypothetical protein [Thermoleophilia bacterium]
MVPAAALLVALVVYSRFAGHLPALSDWGNVAFLALLVIPATFGLVWIALPARERTPGGVLVALALLFVALAAAATVADLEILANVAKLAAATVVGWWFLLFFEAAWWVLLVAVLIVPVDLFSVARGPTKEITENQPHVFDTLSIFLRIPGETGTANLGLPDVLFFALFLGASVRFGLRTGATWLAMTLSFGATLALAVALDRAGVAALPLLSLAFVLVNGDLLWRSARARSSV